MSADLVLGRCTVISTHRTGSCQKGHMLWLARSPLLRLEHSPFDQLAGDPFLYCAPL